MTVNDYLQLISWLALLSLPVSWAILTLLPALWRWLKDQGS